MADDTAVNIGGTFKNLARGTSVNVGGVWKTVAEIHVNVAGTWKRAWRSLFVDTSVITDHSNTDVSPVYANVKLDNDGKYYRSDATGSYAGSTGAYTNDTSLVWVERTIDSGSLNTDDIGASRVACTTDREIGVEKVGSAGKVCVVTLNFYDAASSGNLLGTKQITLSATVA